jgi:cyanophycin synthetase
MRRVELRDLDGPNLFLLAPAIKLELAVGPEDLAPAALAALAARLEPLGLADDAPPARAAALGGLLADALVALCERAGAAEPDVHWAPLEEPGHHALAWTWDHRRFALGVGEAVAAVATGEAVDLRAEADRLRGLLAERDPDDAPLMLPDAARDRPIVAVTGTNGKTTTTRLIAHVLTGAGLRPGWSTTAGVYVAGERVLDGDYSGPTGARAVLDAPGVEVAVLETARGGILQRGLAYERNDVSVFTNISGDHLGLNGVLTVEGLARVKSVVVRVTRPDGWAVLNADDPLVRGAAAGVHAGRFWVTQDPANPTWSPTSPTAAGRCWSGTGRSSRLGASGSGRCSPLPRSRSPSAAPPATWSRTRSAPPPPAWHSGEPTRRSPPGCAPSAATPPTTPAATRCSASAVARS